VIFLFVFTVLVALSMRQTMKVAKIQHDKREATKRIILDLHPLHQAKVEAARRHQRETIKLEQSFILELLEHDLERYTTLHRIPAETYLLNEEPLSLTPLPSLKPVSRDAPFITQNNLLPARYDLLDIFRAHEITPDHIFLGKGDAGQEIFCAAKHLHHGCFNASTGRGKTVLERGILTQLLHIGHLGGDLRSGSQILDMSAKELFEFLRANNIQLGRGIGMMRNEFVQPEAGLVSLGTASNEAVYYLLGRADDFILPDLEDVASMPVSESPEVMKARELWQAGHTSDRKLKAAMKTAGFEISLYRANQPANQFNAGE
jgi:hypothetical protein